jgi:secreted trypsin-like serine protease
MRTSNQTNIEVFFVVCWACLPIFLTCGVPSVPGSINANLLNKIINGDDAVANSWPWIASLRIISSSNSISRHFCGGALIDSMTVVTAAHCVNRRKPSDLAVVMGISSLAETISVSNLYGVAIVYQHPSYDSNLISNDIAVLKLSKSVTFSAQISPVCLPASNDSSIVYNKNLVAIGWGLNENQVLPNLLQQTTLRVINGQSICQVANVYSPTRNLCVIDPDTNRDSNICSGDSGGPLIYYNGANWVIYGIASFGMSDNTNERCISTLPAYFTSVPFYLDYILNPYGANKASSLMSFNLLKYFGLIIALLFCLFSINF